MERLETRLEGPVLVRPVVHGDHRGFFHESYRREVYADLGIAEEFVQDNHSRSATASCAGCTSRSATAWPSSSAAPAARSSTWWSTCAAARRRFGEWEAFRLDEENLHQLYCPVGFAHGFVVVGEMADVMYKCSSYYDESIERGIAYDDPDVAIEWPAGVELQVSARDASAPRLRDVEDDLPFVFERALTAS